MVVVEALHQRQVGMGNPLVSVSLIPMPKEVRRAVRRAESQAEPIRVAAARLVAKRVAQGLPPSGSESEAEAEESLRRRRAR